MSFRRWEVGSIMTEVDMQLKAAFTEMQSKMAETKQKLRMLDMKIQAQHQFITRCGLTIEELSKLDPATPTYQTIGQMFLKQSLEESISQQKRYIDEAKEKVAGLEKNKMYLEKSSKEAEANLRELVSAKRATK